MSSSETDVQQPATASPVSAGSGGAKATKKNSGVEKKAKSAASKPTHPPTSDMVNNAIKGLKERGGSSLQAIKKYIGSNYKVDSEKLAPFIRKYLKAAVQSGSLIQTKGKGASGSFKLANAGTATAGAQKKKAAAAKKQSKAKSAKAVSAGTTTAAAKKPATPSSDKKKKKAAAASAVKSSKAGAAAKSTTAAAAAKKAATAAAAAEKKPKAAKSPSKAKKTAKSPTKKPKAPKPKTVKTAAPKKAASPKKKK